MDNPKVKAQVSIEFVISFVLLALFAVLVAKVFVWFESTTVNRHRAYESTRSTRNAGSSSMDAGVDFFNSTSTFRKRPMNLFNETK